MYFVSVLTVCYYGNDLWIYKLQIYQEINQERETKEFSSVLTPVDMYDQLKMQTKELMYHRIPMSDDMAPTEQVWDLNFFLFNKCRI